MENVLPPFAGVYIYVWFYAVASLTFHTLICKAAEGSSNSAEPSRSW